MRLSVATIASLTLSAKSQLSGKSQLSVKYQLSGTSQSRDRKALPDIKMAAGRLCELISDGLTGSYNGWCPFTNQLAALHSGPEGNKRQCITIPAGRTC